MKNHAKSGPVEMDTCVWETLWKPGGERPLPQGGLWDAELMGTGTLGRSLTRRTSGPGRCLRQAWPKGQGHSLPKAHTLLSAHMPLSIMAHMPPSRHRTHTGLHSAPPRPSAKTVSKGLMQPAQHSREGFPGAPALSAGTPGAVAFWVLAGSLLCPCRVTPATRACCAFPALQERSARPAPGQPSSTHSPGPADLGSRGPHPGSASPQAAGGHTGACLHPSPLAPAGPGLWPDGSAGGGSELSGGKEGEAAPPWGQPAPPGADLCWAPGLGVRPCCRRLVSLKNQGLPERSVLGSRLRGDSWLLATPSRQSPHPSGPLCQPRGPVCSPGPLPSSGAPEGKLHPSRHLAPSLDSHPASHSPRRALPRGHE